MINGNSYFGGKGSDGTYQRIINRIPKVDLLIETHAGLARVSENLANKPLIILNDINPKTVKALYVKFRKYLTEDINAKSGIIIENMDAIQLLEKYKGIIQNRETLIFTDPPYPMDSRKQSVKVYEFEYTDSQHYELLQYLNNLDTKVIVCTYPCGIYADFFGLDLDEFRRVYKNLDEFRRVESGKVQDFSFITHENNHAVLLSDGIINQEGLKRFKWSLIPYFSQTRKGRALEWMFLNYQPPEKLQDCRFFGENYRDREKWKKIMNNLNRKIQDLPSPLRHKLKEEL